MCFVEEALHPIDSVCPINHEENLSEINLTHTFTTMQEIYWIKWSVNWWSSCTGEIAELLWDKAEKFVCCFLLVLSLRRCVRTKQRFRRLAHNKEQFPSANGPIHIHGRRILLNIVYSTIRHLSANIFQTLFTVFWLESGRSHRTSQIQWGIRSSSDLLPNQLRMWGKKSIPVKTNMKHIVLPREPLFLFVQTWRNLSLCLPT